MLYLETNNLTKKDNVILLNIVEEFVKAQVKESIKEHDVCSCETCYLNACAIALNALQPKYVTTTKGTLMEEISAMQPNNYTNILVEVTKAVMKVDKFPHH